VWAKYICNLARTGEFEVRQVHISLPLIPVLNQSVNSIPVLNQSGQFHSSLYLYMPLRVQCQATLCGTWGGQSGTETGFCPKDSGLGLVVLFHQCCILILLSFTYAV
jgi:hypothetical protein